MTKNFSVFLLLVLLFILLLSSGSSSLLFGGFFVFFFFCCYFFPLAFFSENFQKLILENILLSLLTGFSFFIILCYLSFIFFKNAYPALALFALVSFYSVFSRGNTFFQFFHQKSASWGSLPCLVFFILISAYWVYGINYIWVSGDFVRTWQFDWSWHNWLARKVLAHGLPTSALINHKAYSVLLAALSQFSGFDLRELPRAIGVLSWLALSLTLWLLLEDFKIRKEERLVFALAPFFWGGVFLDSSYVSAVFYWNLTQILSILLTAFFLLSLKKFSEKKGLFFLFLSIFFLCVGAHLKPSLFIVFLPALLIFFVLTRRPWKEWALAFLVLAPFFLLYIHPVFFDFPEVKSSSFKLIFSWKELKSRGLSILSSFGILVFPFLHISSLTLKELFKARKIDFLKVTVVALCGGVLFALFFSQTAKISHGNQNWSYKGALTLFVPLGLAYGLQIFRKHRLLKLFFVLGASLNLLSGFKFFLYYPISNYKIVNLERGKETPKNLPQVLRELIWIKK